MHCLEFNLLSDSCDINEAKTGGKALRYRKKETVTSNVPMTLQSGGKLFTEGAEALALLPNRPWVPHLCRCARLSSHCSEWRQREGRGCGRSNVVAPQGSGAFTLESQQTSTCWLSPVTHPPVTAAQGPPVLLQGSCSGGRLY